MVEVYIDGASAGDPGQSGAGIYIKKNGENYSYSIPLGIKENHEAEFYACIKALQICKEKDYSVLSFRSDSQAVVNAVEKEFAKNKKYGTLLEEILILAKEFDLFFIKWIPSKENKRADELARKAIHLNSEPADE
ncbi:reverse transcriptase-like protein [Rossellomorea vietnamensis]|uniref:Reverse transcriptase-like protein n=1 Tax=Rossellomorea vietnamensis TaxID=218284 RepID=A0A5D4MKZ9_9BACI|nr:reverse transcriptase-like protein [Rossellomorea vietnamensis]TYS01661.1 reverse transcriptase-like protein [Rossellomorea vietnamensis]